MRTLIYSIQSSFKNIWNEKWVNFLTILSVSVGLLIISAFASVTFNLDSLIKRWAKSFGIVVYVDDKLSIEAENTLKEFFERDQDIIKIQHISKEQAITDLQQILGQDANILDDFKDNPLPSSFILNLKRKLLSPSFVQEKAAKIKQMKGVDDVEYGEQWLSSLNSLSRIMKISATFLGSSIFLAIVFITYNTIKIFFFRRKDEIETLKLLGATRGFIRLPFLIEGLFIGTAGGIIGSLLLFGIQSLALTKGIESFPSIKAVISTLPLQVYLVLPVTGAVMSFLGSFIAVGKLRF